MVIIKTKEKVEVIFLCLINILLSSCLIVVTFLTKGLIDTALTHNENSWKQLLLYACFLILTVIFQITLKIVYNFILNKSSIKYELSLKQEIYNSYLKKDISQINSIHSGEMSNIYINDVKNIVDGYYSVLPSAILNISKFLFAFISLLIIDWRFLIVALVVGLLAFIYSRFYGKKVKKLQRDSLDKDGKLISYMQESTENIKLIKAMNAEENAEDLLKTKSVDNFNAKYRYRNFAIIGSAGILSVLNITYIAALIYGAIMLYKFPEMFSYGTLVSLLQLVNYFETPFTSLSHLLNKYYAFNVSKSRIQKVFDLKEEIVEDKSFDFEKIVFDDVSFNYDKKVIKNFSCIINKDDLVIIKGRSGIGKSTIINLLLGFIKPQSGIIYFIDTTGNKIMVSSNTRNKFSYVPQEVIMFSGTIRENIKLFVNNKTDEEIVSALKLSCIYDEIMQMPKGLDNVLSERGQGLSLGQIQRILIAIAILKDNDILLLDEFTSALDKNVEAKIVNNMLTLNKTIIMISHRALDVPNHKEVVLGEIIDD